MAAVQEGQVIGAQSVEVWRESFQKANDSQKLVVIDFTASWCGPCRHIAPVLAELAKTFASGAIFFKVDIDELKSVAEEFGVGQVPTFILLKGGNTVDTVVGANKDALEQAITKHVGSVST